MPWSHKSFWIGPILIALILGVLALAFSKGKLRRIYEKHLGETRRERLFLASLGFFVSALVVRGITVAIHYDIGPFHDVSMGGRHIHHMVWGILLLLFVGYLWLVQVGTGLPDSSAWVGRLCSMVYGVAAALTLDEFALWLNLKDVYWQRQGRESYEALALFGGVLAIGIFGAPLFRAMVRDFLGFFSREKSPR